jgi:hypothetical protein
MTLLWHHWAILGVLLIVTELVIPTLVLVWFGLGALIVALLMAAIPSLEFVPQLLVWGFVSVAFVGLWFKVFKPYRHKTLIGRSSAAEVGEVGLLVDDVDNFKKSKVRFQKPVLGSDVWECIADKPITAGSRVKIVSVEGTFLKITSTEH